MDRKAFAWSVAFEGAQGVSTIMRKDSRVTARILEAPSGAARKEAEFATEEDVTALLGAAGEPWRTLWLVIAYTGLRRGEALSLTWFDVDLDARELRVREGKTARAGGPSRWPSQWSTLCVGSVRLDRPASASPPSHRSISEGRT